MDATLLAALIAATAPVVTLMITITSKRASELRVAHRRALEPYVHEIGDALHQVIATSAISLKRDSDEFKQNWGARSAAARDTLKKLRPKVRYPLWGIDGALQSVARLPDWASHLREFPESAQQMLNDAGRLAATLDGVIRRSYLKGRPPTIYDRIRVRYRERSFRTKYTRIMATDRSLRS